MSAAVYAEQGASADVRPLRDLPRLSLVVGLNEGLVVYEFKGIEDVDPVERSRQQALTDALWKQLLKDGIQEGTPGKIECIFFAKDMADIEALLPAFGDWHHKIYEPSEPEEKYIISVVTDLVHLSKEAFLELVDVSLIAANVSSCTFDGFQIDTTELTQRPWWKIW